MLEQIFLNLSGGNGWMPHGFNIQWTPGLLWSYVISDTLIALSYFTIPFALACYIRHRKDRKFRWIFLMFAGFVLACSIHLISVFLLWQPFYWVDVILKAITAALSIITAICLVRIIPQALRLLFQIEFEQRKVSQLALQESENNLRLPMSHKLLHVCY